MNYLENFCILIPLSLHFHFSSYISLLCFKALGFIPLNVSYYCTEWEPTHIRDQENEYERINCKTRDLCMAVISSHQRLSLYTNIHLLVNPYEL